MPQTRVSPGAPMLAPKPDHASLTPGHALAAGHEALAPGRAANHSPKQLAYFAKLRGVSVAALEHFQITAYRGNLRIPMFAADGRLVGHQMRRVNGEPYSDCGQKTRTESGGRNGLIRPAVIPADQALLICESVMDGCAAYDAGHRNIVVTAGSKPGPCGEEAMRALMRQCGAVVLATHGDEAGFKWRELMRELAAGEGCAVRIIPILVGKDLLERRLAGEDVLRLIAGARVMPPLERPVPSPEAPIEIPSSDTPGLAGANPAQLWAMQHPKRASYERCLSSGWSSGTQDLLFGKGYNLWVWALAMYGETEARRRLEYAARIGCTGDRLERRLKRIAALKVKQSRRAKRPVMPTVMPQDGDEAAGVTMTENRPVGAGLGHRLEDVARAIDRRAVELGQDIRDRMGIQQVLEAVWRRLEEAGGHPGGIGLEDLERTLAISHATAEKFRTALTTGWAKILKPVAYGPNRFWIPGRRVRRYILCDTAYRSLLGLTAPEAASSGAEAPGASAAAPALPVGPGPQAPEAQAPVFPGNTLQGPEGPRETPSFSYEYGTSNKFTYLRFSNLEALYAAAAAEGVNLTANPRYDVDLYSAGRVKWVTAVYKPDASVSAEVEALAAQARALSDLWREDYLKPGPPVAPLPRQQPTGYPAPSRIDDVARVVDMAGLPGEVEAELDRLHDALSRRREAGEWACREDEDHADEDYRWHDCWPEEEEAMMACCHGVMMS